MKLFVTTPVTLTKIDIHVSGIKIPPFECDQYKDEA